MQLSLQIARKLKNTGYLLLGGAVLGPLYTVFSDGFASIYPYINALLSGLCIAVAVAFYEFVLFKGSLRKLKFYQLFFLRVTFYVITLAAIIMAVLVVMRMFRFHMSAVEVLRSDEFALYLSSIDFRAALAYTFVIVMVANFSMEMNRKMGQGVLLEFITGKYYRPREAPRFVLFLKILHSKKFVEKKGGLEFLRFLNDVVYDVTEVILLRKGVVYEYVEDEIVMVWDPKNGLKHSHCLQAFFDIESLIKRKQQWYLERYDFKPEFAASLHFDKIIVGEIGEVKSEIKYQGDAMNTASRILGITSSESRFLISSEVLNVLPVAFPFTAKDIGEFQLKGKLKPVRLYSLDLNR